MVSRGHTNLVSPLDVGFYDWVDVELVGSIFVSDSAKRCMGLRYMRDLLSIGLFNTLISRKRITSFSIGASPFTRVFFHTAKTQVALQWVCRRVVASLRCCSF